MTRQPFKSFKQFKPFKPSEAQNGTGSLLSKIASSLVS
jgi:hypothetical protein